MLKARLLGTFELTVDGTPVGADRFERPSGIRLIKLLLATPAHRVRREAAADMLWPESDAVSSGASLRKALHFARKALASGGADGVIASDGTAIEIRAALVEVDLDQLLYRLDQLEATWISGQQTDRAAQLALLKNLEQLGANELLPDDPYEEWLVPLRERLRARSLDNLIRGAGIARELGERLLASALIDRALTLDSADEDAHRLAIELYLDADQIHAARLQLVACRRAMLETFGVEPNAELVRLIDEAVAHRPAGRMKVEPEAPLVGRRIELEATESAFDVVSRGRAAQILLRGVAGIGKSRLLRELVGAGGAAQWQLVEVRGIESAADVPYGQLGPALASALTVERLGELPPTARAALGTVVPKVGTPSVTLASDAALARGVMEVVGVLSDRPTVIAVDDVQWLDEQSLELLPEIIDHLRDRPLLLLLALREDPSVGVGGRVGELLAALSDAGAAVVRVGPLGAREIHVLLERDVEGERVDEGLSTAISELASGAPLFALEIFRSARSDGTLRQRDGVWQLGSGGGLVRATSGVTRLVEQRVNQLDAMTRTVLSTAAELGDSVSFEVLNAALDDSDEAVLDALDAAMAANLLVEANAQYTFAHPLFRAALRQGLPTRARGNLHARVAKALSAGIDPQDATAIETAVRNGVDVPAVAAHAGEAASIGRKDVLPMAVGFGVGAGQRQLELFDYAAAARTLGEAVRWWHALVASERASFPITDAHVSMGQALRRLGEDPAARAAFAAAISTARTDAEAAKAYSAAAWLPYEHGHFDQADEILLRGLAAVTDPVAQAVLSSERGWVFHRMGRGLEARVILEEAVATLTTDGNSVHLVRALDRLGVVVADVDSPRDAVHILQRSLALTAEFGDTNTRSAAHIHLCEAYGALGRFDAADEQITQALGVARISGDQYMEAVALWVKAELEDRRGRLADAVECRRLELEVLAKVGGNARHEAMAHAHLASIDRRLGDAGGAAGEAAAARTIAHHAADKNLPGLIEHALSAAGWPPY